MTINHQTKHGRISNLLNLYTKIKLFSTIEFSYILQIDYSIINNVYTSYTKRITWFIKYKVWIHHSLIINEIQV